MITLHRPLVTRRGAFLIVAGVAVFFAWNWWDYSHAVKFASSQAGVVAAAALCLRLGIDSIDGRVALFSTAILVGVLLAVFGQVYQTGADPYDLFVAWSIVIFPLALIGRQAALWMLLQTVLTLALIMYWTEVVDTPNDNWKLAELFRQPHWLTSRLLDSIMASLVFALNAVALVAWEYAAGRDIPWLQGRTCPRIVGTGVLASVLVPTLVWFFDPGGFIRPRFAWIYPVLYLAASTVGLYYYRYRRPDLLMLTILVTGALLLIGALVWRLPPAETDIDFFIAALLIGLMACMAWWLYQVSRQWGSGR